MIPIEQQVTSLEISQKLKKFGVPQGQSYFVWVAEHRCLTIEPHYIANAEFECRSPGEYEILCDAFTVNEMFKLFPKIGVYPSIEFSGKNYSAQYNEGNEFFFEENNLYPATALAKILCRIIRNESFQEYMKTDINPQDLKL